MLSGEVPAGFEVAVREQVPAVDHGAHAQRAVVARRGVPG